MLFSKENITMGTLMKKFAGSNRPELNSQSFKNLLEFRLNSNLTESIPDQKPESADAPDKKRDKKEAEKVSEAHADLKSIKTMSVSEIKLMLNKKLKANVETIKQIQAKNSELKKLVA